MSFNMFSNVSTNSGENDRPDYKPLPEGSYIIQFIESTKRVWDGIPQVSFRFNTPFRIDTEKNSFEPIQKVTGRDSFNVFSSFKIFKPIEFDNVELGLEHNEKPLRALLMATKSLTAYDTDEEVQQILQIPVVPTYHARSNGITNHNDIVDGYISLFNNILLDTACKADVTHYKTKAGKTYNNIKWYKPLSDLEVKILEEGVSSPTSDVAASDSVAEPNFKNQAPSPFAQAGTGTELTDDDIPF